MLRDVGIAFRVLALAVLAVPSWGLTLSDLREESRALVLDSGPRLRFSTATLDDFLNEGQRIAVLDAKPIRKSARFELVAGTTFYSLPADFLQLQRVTLRYYDLQEMSPEALANRGSLRWEEAAGLPTHYFINFASRTKVGFYPFPDSSSSTGTVRYDYYAQATDMSATTDQPFGGDAELDPHHYLIAFYAAARMAAIDGRADLAVLYRTEFLEGLERLKREANARPSYRPGAIPGTGTGRTGP